MKTAIATLKSVSAYSQSKHVMIEKEPKETHADFEKRIWRERVSCTPEGDIFIPPMAFKNCIAAAAKFLSIQIPGKGKSTYTKHFEAGVLVAKPVILPYKKDTIEGEWLHVPSDGMRGGTKRVMKCFPLIPKWEADVEFLILDETITEEVFKNHLEQAGAFIGIGRFRPRNNGYYGRFQVEKLVWK